MQFDYVIVGGGSAGATLAARLSKDPAVSVCLLEAGGEGRNIFIRAPAGAVAFVPGYGKLCNWAFRTEPQPGLNGRRGFQPRGRALGGSSAINAMLYVRGNPGDYDDWADNGCLGWSYRDVLPYFKRAEANQNGANDFHGATGPLQVADQISPRPISLAFVEAAHECQIPVNRDFNGPDQEGAGLYQVTQFWNGSKRGERCSAAAAYLHPAIDRPNLTVLTRARATRILFERGRAVGVAVHKAGNSFEIAANREVILSGGAFNSPQLLLLSGIGPADELARHGIPVFREMPGVGKNLQDHIDTILYYRTENTDVLGLGFAAIGNVVRAVGQWRRTGTGLVTTPYAEGGAFLKSDPGLDRPDLQLHFVIALVENHARKPNWGYGYSCHVCALRPHSRSEVGLSSADPLAAPRIDPRYLSDPRDADLMVKGLKIARRIMHAPALDPYRQREMFLENADNDADLLAYIRSRADTIYHPVGTCRMGSDDGAVVDPQLRVRGVDGLRVVDASIMPTLIGGNTNAPTIMIAEKAADLIRAGT